METKSTPGPWKWRDGQHVGTFAERCSRTLCSMGKDCITADGRNLGPAVVLVPAAKIMASKAHLIRDIHLEIHGSQADEALIAAAPDMREALRAVLLRFDLEPKEEVFPGSALREDIRAALALADGKAVPA